MCVCVCGGGETWEMWLFCGWNSGHLRVIPFVCDISGNNKDGILLYRQKPLLQIPGVSEDGDKATSSDVRGNVDG